MLATVRYNDELRLCYDVDEIISATDAKKFMRLCGQPVAEADKLHIMNYDVYGIDDEGIL